MNDTELRFMESFNTMQRLIGDNAVAHGFYVEESQRYFKCGPDGEFEQVDLSQYFKGTRLALQTSEISEALEAIRNSPPGAPKMDDHCPELTNIEIEMADAVIRIMDMAQFYGYRLAEAIIRKHAFNVGRPMKHGKNF